MNIEQLQSERKNLVHGEQTTLWATLETILRGAVEDTENKFKTVFDSRDNSVMGYSSFFTNHSERAFKLSYRYKFLKRAYDTVMYYSESKDEALGLASVMFLEHEINNIESLLLRGKIRRQSTDWILNHSHLLEREEDQIILSDLKHWVRITKDAAHVWTQELQEFDKEYSDMITKPIK
jgi:hypothetical protein